MKVADAAVMRDIDNKTISQIGIPSIILMENAANAVVLECLKHLKNFKNKVLVVCGRGNNGGDGLAVARILNHKGVDVSVLFVGDERKVSGDAKVNLDIVLQLQIPIFNSANSFVAKDLIDKSDIVVDSIIGTGLKGEISSEVKEVIDYINDSSCYRIAVDIASGLNSDNGKIMGTCVKAHKTVTFALLKKGLLLFPGTLYTGEIIVADIGIPQNIIDAENINCNVLDNAKNMLPKRDKRSNKGSFATVFVIAGSDSMSGACYLACHACYKTGAGVVYAASTASVIKVIQNKIAQALTITLHDIDGRFSLESFNNDIKPYFKNSNVVILGPGIGKSINVSEFVYQTIKNVTGTLIIDADGLNAVADNVDILLELKASCIITPHPKEMSRLTGQDVTYILDNIIETATDFAKKYNVVVLLKDAHSIIADPKGNVYINTTGNSALAKAGSGDILTGIIGGLVSCGSSPFDAAVLGVYILGKSCERASELLGEFGVMDYELLNNIPLIIKSL